MSVTLRSLTRLYYREMKEISFKNDVLPLKNKLYRLALHITCDTAEAEDVVQETMIRVWNKREEWQQYNSIEALCITICRNLAIDQSQKKDSRNAVFDISRHEHSDISTPHEHLAAREGLNILQGILQELPEKQRAIVELRDVENKTYKEIASALNITEEQVKSYLFRARQKIRLRYTEIQDYGL